MSAERLSAGTAQNHTARTIRYARLGKTWGGRDIMRFAVGAWVLWGRANGFSLSRAKVYTEAHGMASISTTHKCCECGTEQTAPATSKKWKGWRVWLDNDTRALLGFLCPTCYEADKEKYR